MERASSDNPAGLSEDQKKALRRRLERLRAELRARLEREQPVILQAEHLTEPADAAEQTREQDDAILFTGHDRALLAEVEHALAKLHSGQYGVSEASGRPIGFARLEAVPWARLAADEVED